MDTVLMLIKQTLTMFLLAGGGFALFKCGKITKEGSKVIGNILIYASLPCVLIASFQLERTPEHMLGLGISAALGIGMILLCVLVSRLCFRSDPIAQFASSFPNPGFFGIPLILASLGGECVFYVAAFIACVNMGQWTYGVSIMTGQNGKIDLKTVLKAPFMVAIVLGLVLFFSGWQLPGVVQGCLNAIKEINTPLAMFSVGVYLAQTNPGKMLIKKQLYLISAVRLVLIPCIALLLLWLLPQDLLQLKLAMLIAVSCPVGSNIAVYAQLHGKDYTYAVETVIISTVLAILTMPCLVSLAQLLWNL